MAMVNVYEKRKMSFMDDPQLIRIICYSAVSSQTLRESQSFPNAILMQCSNFWNLQFLLSVLLAYTASDTSDGIFDNFTSSLCYCSFSAIENTQRVLKHVWTFKHLLRILITLVLCGALRYYALSA